MAWQSGVMVRRWQIFGDFLHPVFSASNIQCIIFPTCILNLHQGHIICGNMVDIQSVTAEIRPKKEERRRNHRGKIQWAAIISVVKMVYVSVELHCIFTVYVLWPPCVADADNLFCSCVYYLFFHAYSQQSEIGCLPYFDTWCGLSANLECRFEMCCTQLTENTACKKSPSAHLRTTSSRHIFATKACIDNRKKTC